MNIVQYIYIRKYEKVTIDPNESWIDMTNVAVFAGWIIVIIIANVCAIPTVEDAPGNKQNLEQILDVIEGDIIPTPTFRKARGLVGIGNNVRWTDGIVPYEFISGYTVEQQAEIVTRMRKLENLVAINNSRCIQFRPKVSGDLYYLKIQNGADCRSMIGQIGGGLMLAYPLCFDDGRTFHELLHTLGFYHEQSRSDRDSYVRLYPENMQTGMDQQYLVYNNPVADTFNSPYDYASVMHYGRYDYSKNNLSTMEPIQSNIKIGQRYNLSNGDIQLIRRYYNCSSNGPTLPPFTVPIKPAFGYLTTSTYSSELTKQNLMYTRNGSSSGNYYYELIKITVSAAGVYFFQCNSNIDTFAYLYSQAFNPLNPVANLYFGLDDENAERWEFSFQLTFPTAGATFLVVTTYSPSVTGPFSIVASGNTTVTFNRTVGTAQPTSTTSTTTKPTSTTTMPTTSTTSTTTMTTTSTTTKPTTSTTSTTTKPTTSTTSTTTMTTTSTTTKPTTSTTPTTTMTTITTTNSTFNIGRWSTTGSLSIGRVGHTSTLLSDKRVITIGGKDGYTVELYNSATRTWSRGTSMNNGRMHFTATLLPDGRLFVVGGWYYSDGYSKTAEIYNPVNNSWAAVSNLTFARFAHQAVYLPAPVNKVLVMGGVGENNSYTVLQSCELYDFVSNKWTVTTSMNNPRSHFTATYIPSMNVVVAIGVSDQNSAAEIFNISTLQWTQSLNAMSDSRGKHTATLLPNGQILVAGNSYSIATTYLFNPTTKLFTYAANTTEQRVEPCATLLPSGSVLLTGGFTSNGSIYRSAEVYDYRFNTWRRVADMNIGHARHTAVFLNDSSSTLTPVLVIGGYKDVGALTDCELFSVNG
ncbi:unnamed protein product [Adineta steineri]|uniref:Metalloendopeptidase n=1 Tax=Adineta steineri TaxID=433720 RepID=A0A814DYA2_9BILA|nr:unnamed protein product [Adineta steineri]